MRVALIDNCPFCEWNLRLSPSGFWLNPATEMGLDTCG